MSVDSKARWGRAATTPEWFADWRDQVCAVVASGESATKDEVEKCRGRCRVAVVNNGYELAPWSDLLYVADGNWWSTYPDALRFAGLKVTGSVAAACYHKLHHARHRDEADPEAHRFYFEGPIGHFGNSGCQALNLVLQFGCRRVILIGFDYCGEHWHRAHQRPLRNPTSQRLEAWRRRLDGEAEALRACGVEVVNASPISALTAYRKMTVDLALEHFGQ